MSEIAALTPGMRKALDMLCNDYVFADARSVRALIKRGLVADCGDVEDSWLGRYQRNEPTRLGREVHARLEAQGDDHD